jgi:hypothetical protein
LENVPVYYSTAAQNSDYKTILSLTVEDVWVHQIIANFNTSFSNNIVVHQLQLQHIYYIYSSSRIYRVISS